MDKDPDPSKTSFYVSDMLYRKLIKDFTDWRRSDREVSDPIFRESIARLLYREARLLDELDHEGWLRLFASECIYWIPGSSDGSDPRSEVAIAFDDRRRLEDRVFRLRTGNAWSQRPVSRTVRSISNVEVFSAADNEIYMVRSNFQVMELQGQVETNWNGWVGHQIRDKGDQFEILVKQVNLINFDQNLHNPSIIL